MQLIDNSKWRYAAKAMNGDTVSDDKVEKIMEAISLAPTSSGLQPFEVIIIKNPKLKEKIRKIAWDQSVVTDCSHLIVFAAWDTYTEERINKAFDYTNTVRGFTNEGWDNYRQMLLSIYPQRSADENFTHTSKQAYIAFSYAIMAAAELKIDSTPLEGFDPIKLDEILNLNEKGLKSCLMLPIGYRKTDDDWLVNLKKVRKPMNELLSIIE